MNESSAPGLTPEHKRTLQALVARILPGTDGPGATRTDAAVGVERAVVHRAMRGMRPGVEALLDRLDAAAEEWHGTAFSLCGSREQDELLSALERDASSGAPFLFRIVIGLSLEGLLGDPAHGGNRDFLGWSAIGLRAEDVRSGLCRGAR